MEPRTPSGYILGAGSRNTGQDACLSLFHFSASGSSLGDCKGIPGAVGCSEIRLGAIPHLCRSSWDAHVLPRRADDVGLSDAGDASILVAASPYNSVSGMRMDIPIVSCPVPRVLPEDGIDPTIRSESFRVVALCMHHSKMVFRLCPLGLGRDGGGRGGIGGTSLDFASCAWDSSVAFWDVSRIEDKDKDREDAGGGDWGAPPVIRPSGVFRFTRPAKMWFYDVCHVPWMNSVVAAGSGATVSRIDLQKLVAADSFNKTNFGRQGSGRSYAVEVMRQSSDDLLMAGDHDCGGWFHVWDMRMGPISVASKAHPEGIVDVKSLPDSDLVCVMLEGKSCKTCVYDRRKFQSPLHLFEERKALLPKSPRYGCLLWLYSNVFASSRTYGYSCDTGLVFWDAKTGKIKGKCDCYGANGISYYYTEDGLRHSRAEEKERVGFILEKLDEADFLCEMVKVSGVAAAPIRLGRCFFSGAGPSQ